MMGQVCVKNNSVHPKDDEASKKYSGKDGVSGAQKKNEVETKSREPLIVQTQEVETENKQNKEPAKTATPPEDVNKIIEATPDKTEDIQQPEVKPSASELQPEPKTREIEDDDGQPSPRVTPPTPTPESRAVIAAESSPAPDRKDSVEPEPGLILKQFSKISLNSKKSDPDRFVTKFVYSVVKSKDDFDRRKINQYTVIKHLGSGRYGEVQLVENDKKELYAMKEVCKKLFKKSGENKEVDILARIDHRNAVKLFEVIDDATMKEQYLILEYVDGGPSMTINDKGKALQDTFEEETLRYYLQQIAEGLQYLHDCNIIHRDIKPENILITRDRRTIKLADFGVSRAMTSEDDGSRETGGTPLFLSPETCSGDFSSGKANDIWALGVTLYIFMYGKPPFTAPGGNEILLYNKIMDEEIQYPNTRKKYSPELYSLLKRMLERNVLLRITLNEIRNNSWVRGSSAPVPDEELANFSTYRTGSVGAGNENLQSSVISPMHLEDCRCTGQPNQVNILIVEDVFLIQKVTMKMFKSIIDETNNLLNIKVVADGEDAIDACKNTRFHLVLMDVHMSRVSGITATCKIREFEGTNKLVPTNILGLTADPHEDMERVCMEAGMYKVLQKPLQPSVLRELCIEFELPVVEGETNFNVADFNKGEVRGGGQKNAYLKSYQEHLTKTSPRPLSSQNQREPAAEATESTVGTVVESDGQSSVNTSDEDGPKIVGALSDGDMRSRSLQCMKMHQNMYKKKNCDKIFQYVEEDEKAFAGALVLHQLYDECTWDHLNSVTSANWKQLYDTDMCELENYLSEIMQLNSDVIPAEELVDRFRSTTGWHTVSGNDGISGEDQVKQVRKHQVFVHADKGQRGGMEDYSGVILNPVATLRSDNEPDSDELIVGVYDGHGGRYAAEYCASYLLAKIVLHGAYLTDISKAMKESFEDAHKCFLKKVEAADCDAGTTALVAVVRNNVLTVGNIGDCRLVLYNPDEDPIQINKLHVCDDEAERERVESRGGSVIYYMGSWRVNGVLLVTRSIGDLPCKDVVSRDADIFNHTIRKNDQFAVIASDGLWDVMSPAEVCEAVAQAKEELDALKDEPPEEKKSADSGDEEDEEEEEGFDSLAVIPEALVSEALERGSADNITCAIVFFG